MATIESIKETTFSTREGYCGYDGFVIEMTDGTDIKMGISNYQSCCENWGYLMSEDNLDDFIGAYIYSIEGVGQALEHVQVPSIYEGGIMFINISTSKGLLQFVAYNGHNGYYSHDAVVIQNGVTLEQERL